MSMRLSRAGFTLVEILTALFVLAIGISGTLAIVMRSAQMAASAGDRNNASVLIPEAIEDIKHLLTISSSMTTANGGTLDPYYNGMFMDTLSLNGGNPFGNSASCNIPFFNRQTGSKAYVSLNNLAYPPNAAAANLAYWPLTPNASRVMGQFPQPPGVDPLLSSSGAAYRALFKLEPHPDWIKDANSHLQANEDPTSAFAGIYILTVTMYRDLDPSISTTSVNPMKKLQQVSDPVMVYVRDSKVRQ